MDKPLSTVDLRILEVLQHEGDISNLRLAEAICLSPSPCLQRVRKLRSQGYIQGVSAVVDLRRLTQYVVVHCSIGLVEQTTRHLAAFEAAVLKIPEVLECSAISGDYNYLLKIVARDMEHYAELLRSMMEMNIGVKTHASVVEVKNVKRSLAFPLRSLLNGRFDGA
ncbi:Lrp/AsnC family transcriptional regulator [Ramlibacter sp.]|uniref:Lrp/AsnC family transcriptional regulator n=1 Tax=Ramlibacter sp. TaxID=1917967 RepID=UPI002FC85B9E